MRATLPHHPSLTMGSRALAIAAGLAFTGGALTILLYDVIALGKPWTMAHTLAVLTVVGVIFAGELAREAWTTRHFGSCLGFWLIVVVGTGLVVYNSTGRQAQASTTSTLSVEDRNDQRAAVKAQLAEHQRMLSEEQAFQATEIKRGGCGKVCQGYDASIAVYQSAVTGDESKLKELGAPEPVTPDAEQFAEVMAIFGFNKAKAKALAMLLVPFLYTLMFEYGSIRSWGYAFRKRRVALYVPTPNDSAQTSYPSEPEALPNTYFGVPPTSRREQILNDLLTRSVSGRHFGSQEEAAGHYGISPSRFSEWSKRWEQAGEIPKRKVVGRRKVIAARLN